MFYVVILICLFASCILLIIVTVTSSCGLPVGFKLPPSLMLFIFRVEFDSSPVGFRLLPDLWVPLVVNHTFDLHIPGISCDFLRAKATQVVAPPPVFPECYLPLLEYERALLALDCPQTQRQGRPVAVRR